MRPILALAPLALCAPALAAESGPTEVVEVTSAPTRAERPDLNLDLRNYSLNMQDLRFPSGLRVIFQRDNTQPIVAITAVTDHGASDDPLGKEGIAHLVEHLWFRSEQGDLPKTWDLLESEMGCDLNAFTQYDITAYMTVCASHNLELMMRLEALRISDPVRAVTQEMVNTEIEVVRNEIRMRAENFNIPFFTIWEYLNKHTFPEGHPYQRPMAGDHTSIRNIDIADIVQFTEDYYRPETTTIMIVGDLPRSDFGYLLDLLVRTFDLDLLDKNLTKEHIRRQPRPGISNPDPERDDHWYLVPVNPLNEDEPLPIAVRFQPRKDAFEGLTPPEPVTRDLGVYVGPVKKHTVGIAWTLPAAYQGDDTLMNVAGNLVSGAVNAGVRALSDPNVSFAADDDGGPGCGALTSKRVSTFVCTAVLTDVEDMNDRSLKMVAERVADRMIDQISTVILNFQGEQMERQAMDAQFSLARNSFLAQLFNSTDLYAVVGGGRATSTAQHAHFTGSAQYFSDAMNETLALQSFQVAEFVDTYLKRNRATAVLIKPADRDEVAIVSEDTEGSGGHFRGGGEDAILNPSIPAESITPEFLRELIALPDTTDLVDFTLSNGLRVVIKPHSDVPIVQAELIAFGAGSAYDVDGRQRLYDAFTIHDGDFRAVSNLSAISFSPPLDPLRFAGGWTDGGGSLTRSMGIRGSAGNLDGELWMLRERVETLKPYLSGKSTYLKRWESSIRRSWKNTDWHITDLRSKHLNPGHILSDTVTLDEVQALAKASGADIQSATARIWQPANTVLLITGDVDPNEARDTVIRYFGGWKAAPGVEPVKAPPIPGPNPAEKTAIYVFDDAGKTQTQVTMACPIRAAEADPSPAHELLGDIARMTLFAELREEAGVVYSPFAGVFTQPGGSAFMIMSAAIQNDSAVFALSRYRAFMDKASEGRLAEKDLRIKQLSRASNYVLGQQSISQMASRLTDTIAARQGWDSYERYADALSTVQIADLAALSTDCNEHAFIAFKGPVDKVKAQLDEAGLSYTVVDVKERRDAIYEAADPKGFAKFAKKRAKDEAKKKKKGDDEDESDESDDDSSGM